jgi:hypothetical protein
MIMGSLDENFATWRRMVYRHKVGGGVAQINCVRRDVRANRPVREISLDACVGLLKGSFTLLAAVAQDAAGLMRGLPLDCFCTLIKNINPKLSWDMPFPRNPIR